MSCISDRRRSIAIIERDNTARSGWSEREAQTGEAVSLDAFSFAVDDIYDDIALEPA